jgi:hypothetical protein
MLFHVAEFNRNTCEHTGREETYQSPDIASAVQSVLYTRKLANGGAFIGPSGRVVYAGEFGYSVIQPRSEFAKMAVGKG